MQRPWNSVNTLLETHPAMDAQRVAGTGFSMGGCGTWDALARYLDRWCAGALVCGAYDETAVAPTAGVPVWAFHAADDTVIPVGRIAT